MEPETQYYPDMQSQPIWQPEPETTPPQSQASEQAESSAVRIDPQNPFENPMEQTAYNGDYRMLVPQIAIPGCELPLQPNRAERKRIRHFFNVAGLCAFLGFAGSNFLCSLLMLILLFFLEGSISGGMQAFLNGSESYQFLQNSSALVALTGIAFFSTNFVVTVLGCKATKLRARDLFDTTGFRVSHAVSYILIAFFIQNIAAQASSLVSYWMSRGGMVMYEADMGSYSGTTMLLAQVLYGGLLAPIGEELLFRGVILKNLSRVSQRFGIFMSAALFGLAHENIAQFLLAFLLGIFLAEIDMRHNSLLPSIMVHVAVNVLATGSATLAEWNAMPEWGMLLLNLGYLAVLLLGLILFIFDRRKHHLPYNMPKQSMRTASIAWTSPWLLVICACHLSMMIYLIVQSTRFAG